MQRSNGSQSIDKEKIDYTDLQSASREADKALVVSSSEERQAETALENPMSDNADKISYSSLQSEKEPSATPATNPCDSDSETDEKEIPFDIIVAEQEEDRNGLRRVNKTTTQSGNYVLRGSILGGGEAKIMEQSFLGQGAYGSVKVAVVNVDGIEQEQAVKIIQRPDKAVTQTKAFYDFIIANKIEGLLIPYVMMYNLATQTMFQIMPLGHCDGNKLIALLNQPNLDAQQKELIKRHTIVSLINTFYHLNRYHVRHLDLKPSNIIFDKKGKCLVLDFDFSVIADEKGEYIHAPEEVQTDKKFLPRIIGNLSTTGLERDGNHQAIDAYRLGITLFLICCQLDDEFCKKRPHFHDITEDKAKEFFDKVNLPDDIRLLINGLMKENKANRMKIDEAFELVKSWAVASSEIETLFLNIDDSMTIEADKKDEKIVPTQNVLALSRLAQTSDGEMICDEKELMSALNENDSNKARWRLISSRSSIVSRSKTPDRAVDEETSKENTSSEHQEATTTVSQSSAPSSKEKYQPLTSPGPGISIFSPRALNCSNFLEVRAQLNYKGK